MKFISKILLLIAFACCIEFTANAQAFKADIQAFKSLDSTNKPPANPILFIGSSSFTKWKDVQSYFPGYKILNRGFGGSRITHQINYANDIIFPYNPKQIVIYCGENDIAKDTATATNVLGSFVQLYKLIRSHYADIPVAYISIKPSPKRNQYKQKIEEANTLIADYLSKEKNTSYIDVYHAMYDSEGNVLTNIFLSDSLHMNKDGYAIWQKIIQPYLVK